MRRGFLRGEGGWLMEDESAAGMKLIGRHARVVRRMVLGV